VFCVLLQHRIVIQVKGPEKESGGSGSGRSSPRGDAGRNRQKSRPGYQVRKSVRTHLPFAFDSTV